MFKEIDDKTASIFAGKLIESFAQNGDDRRGQVLHLANLHKKGVRVLDYDEEDLMNNALIRSRLIQAFKDVGAHSPDLRKLPDENIAELVMFELDIGIRGAKNEYYVAEISRERSK